ncbi:MAG: radical SAM protein [Planctomycetota bacterium]|nr:MAG: radical SAM protein [Planctomycetota bacterium]
MNNNIQKIDKVDGLIKNILFGPVKSRRFGVSLGINLLPANNKICSFNCPYCECGWTDIPESKTLSNTLEFPTRDNIKKALNVSLQQYKSSNNPSIEHITLAGNGEPTMHPDFPDIINDIREIVDCFYPDAKFVLLTNGLHLDNDKIKKCLTKIHSVNVKLDAANQKIYKKINGPISGSFDDLILQIKTLKNFNIQTMFIQGAISNIEEDHLTEWFSLIKLLAPNFVQIYSIDRSTPTDKVKKVPIELLENIKNNVLSMGISAQCY